MPAKKPNTRELGLQQRIDELEIRLAEAEDTLRAIREGEVDAVVVSGTKGEQIFSLVGADSIYRLIVETMKEAAVTITFDGTILFSNSQFGKVLGRPLEQVVGHSFLEFVTEEYQASASSLLSGVRKQTVKQRLAFRASEGSTIPVHISANILNQPDGLSICVVANDLTELENSTELIQQLRRHQEALQESEERFRLAVTAANIAIYDIDLTTGKAHTNEIHRTLFGNPPEGADPWQWWVDRIHPQDRERTLGILNSSISGRGSTSICDYRMQRPDGSWAYVYEYASIARDSSGKAYRVLGAMLDQTGQKRSAEALLKARYEAISEKNRLQAALEALPVGMAILDGRGGEIVANAAFEQLWGRSRPLTSSIHDYLSYRGWWAESGRLLNPEEWASAQAVLSGKSVVGQLLEIERFDGSRTFVLNSAAPVFDAEGKVVGCAVAIQDITNLQRAEEALRRTAAELDRSNQDLEQFARVVSHDLQEPLRAITGFLTLLQERYREKLDAKADEYIYYSVDAARRMSHLIHGLLEYSHAGGQSISATRVDFAEILERAKVNLRAAIDESKAVITQDPLPTATADANGMTQVFQNLIGNALKFCAADRRPKVHVSAWREDGAWRFQVQDNGIGIDPQQADRIFLIFRRLHTRSRYPGSGIGLAICKKIIEQHRGRIWVESAPGEGSKFCFTLPEDFDS